MEANDYVLYVCDTETTGFSPVKNDVIEVSFIRMMDGVQKTWCIKPFNFENIGADALRVNGHKYEDITHQTKYGRDVYLEPSKVLIEIENWVDEDGVLSSRRVLVGQNISFDKNHLEALWNKAGSNGSFPFGYRALDTMQIQFALDYSAGAMEPSYSLAALTKKYGVKNDRAHSAAADTKATMEVFQKQITFLKSKISNA